MKLKRYHIPGYLRYALCLCYAFLLFCISSSWFCNGQPETVDVGVIVDMDNFVGKMSKTIMELAVEDFHANNNTYRLLLHFRDSKSDPIEAADAAIDLLKNHQVKAIVAGPQRSREVEFVAEIGTKTQVPILSFTPATSYVESSSSSSYFIRIAQTDTSQLRAIASITRHFNWTQLVPIYEYDDHDSLLFLSDELTKVGATVPYRCRISDSATDDHILMHLYKLMTMQTRVFLVHMMRPSLASRVFSLANKAEMMNKGYAWIISSNLLEEGINTDSMHGVIGVKPYIPNTDNQLDRFSSRWKDKFLQENPDNNQVMISAFGLWAYDSVSLLAKAMQQIRITSKFKQGNQNSNLSDIQMIGVFESGPLLLESIQNTRFEGISGDINLTNGQLPISPFQVINIVGNESRQIGMWTPPASVDDESRLGDVKLEEQVIWPGNSNVIPRGWEIPVSGKTLKVGVPVKSGFEQFISAKRDTSTNAIIVEGFCRDVFEAVMAELPFKVLYEYQLFEKPYGSGESAGTYDELIQAINSPEYEYDAVIGDTTIRANRSEYADFALAYTESGVSMIVPVKRDDRRSGWIFTKPLTTELWITTGGFFIFTGAVIWILEHRVNKAFNDPPDPKRQLGLIMWFSFSTLVFAYTEKVVSNLSRFVLIVWVFVVMVLTSSYTASLTSFLTVQQLNPTVTDISEIISTGGVIGYQDGSFVPDMLKSLLGVDDAHLRVLVTPQDYNDALSDGTVAAIVDELPYLRIVQGNYCSKFRMVGPTYKAAGFGFAFPKGSPLVPEVSRAVLKVMESPTMNDIMNRWFPNKTCSSNSATTDVNSSNTSLRLDNFKGLFLIASISSSLALIIFLIKFLHQSRDIIISQDMSLKQKIVTLAKTFYAPVSTNNDDNNNYSQHNVEDDDDDAVDDAHDHTIEMADFTPSHDHEAS